MGRSTPTYRDQVRALEDQWSDYRRALRQRDRPHFDRLFEHARNHADAAGYLNHDEPVVAVLVSIALAQQREIATLRARIGELESTLEDPESKGQNSPSHRKLDLDESELGRQ